LKKYQDIYNVKFTKKYLSELQNPKQWVEVEEKMPKELCESLYDLQVMAGKEEMFERKLKLQSFTVRLLELEHRSLKWW
jgi:polyhydroxyalkanoate synthesis regulator phasin